MGRVAVIGEQVVVSGYALAGAVVVVAEDASQVRDGWDALAADVEVVVLTARAAEALGTARTAATHLLSVVMPS